MTSKTPEANESRRSWWVELGILAGYALLALVMTFPLVTQLDTHLAGAGDDVWINQWATWWTQQVLTGEAELYHTDYLFYPHGVDLYFHSFSHVASALEILLTPLLGRMAAYNLVIIAAHVLSGYATYLLTSHLTKSRLAGFVAGLIFAFFPQRMSQSTHPVFVNTQWIPFFLLALTRLVEERRWVFVWWTAAFFCLNALSSWHLMTMGSLLGALYLAYLLVSRRGRWGRKLVLQLVVAAVLAVLLLSPLVWPMLRELLQTSGEYVGAEGSGYYGNDLLSFIVPQREHPLLGDAVLPLHQQIGIHKKPAYLGILPLLLFLIGAIWRRKEAAFWVGAGLLFALLSLGGDSVVARVLPMPWLPLMESLIRHPMRLTLIVGVCLSGAAAFGVQVVHSWTVRSSGFWRGIVLSALSGVILIEYLFWPFPTTAADVPAFYTDLAGQDSGGALLELPMGRQPVKRYLFYQPIHERPMVDGVVSRTPPEAYALIDNDYVLRSLYACGRYGWPLAGLEAEFAHLADLGIEYVILHRDLASRDVALAWDALEPLTPAYQDDVIIAYDTSHLDGNDAALPHLLAQCLSVVPRGLSSTEAVPGETLFLDLEWWLGGRSEGAADVEVALLREGVEAQRQVYPDLFSRIPIGQAYVHELAFVLDPWLEPGGYSLRLAVHDPVSGRALDPMLSLGDVRVGTSSRNFAVPAISNSRTVLFGEDVMLLGFDQGVEGESLSLTLYWRAQRRMDARLKVFVHIHQSETGEVVAQHDAEPLNWAYPTTWWEEGEVVIDPLSFDLSDLVPGEYYISVGLYELDTGLRLTHDSLAAQSRDSVELGNFAWR